MKPTDILMQEHRVIEQVLDCLEVEAQRCVEEKKLDTESASLAIDFFRNFADRCHHGKEEDCLFPLMEGKGFSRQQGPTGVMLSEHETGRWHVRGMAAAIEAVDSGDSASIAKFVSHAQDFIRLLREHIQKEDQCLFTMADQAFSEQDQQQLMKSFHQVEHDDLGTGTHEKYLDIAGQLAKRYGVTHRASDAAASTCCHHHES